MVWVTWRIDPSAPTSDFVEVSWLVLPPPGVLSETVVRSVLRTDPSGPTVVLVRLSVRLSPSVVWVFTQLALAALPEVCEVTASGFFGARGPVPTASSSRGGAGGRPACLRAASFSALAFSFSFSTSALRSRIRPAVSFGSGACPGLRSVVFATSSRVARTFWPMGTAASFEFCNCWSALPNHFWTSRFCCSGVAPRGVIPVSNSSS